MILCTMPGCQTTAGCVCDRLGRKPSVTDRTPLGLVSMRHRSPEKFAGDPEYYPKLVAALRAEIASLKDAADRLTRPDPDIRRAALEEAATLVLTMVAFKSRRGGRVVIGRDAEDAISDAIRALSDKGGEHG